MTKKELKWELDSLSERVLKADLEILRLKEALRRIAHLDIKDLPEGTDINEAYVILAGKMIGIACFTLDEWD